MTYNYLGYTVRKLDHHTKGEQEDLENHLKRSYPWLLTFNYQYLIMAICSANNDPNNIHDTL